MSKQPDSPKKTLEGSDPRDRKIFNLNAEQWTKLQESLEAPPRVLPRMEPYRSRGKINMTVRFMNSN